MPEDLAEIRDRYLTAVANSVAAEDARDAALEDVNDAEDRLATAETRLASTVTTEEATGAQYRAALRAHGMVDTASGPVPAPGIYGPNDEERMIADQDRAAQLAEVCECGHTANLHSSMGNCIATACANALARCRGWHPTAEAQQAAADLGARLGLHAAKECAHCGGSPASLTNLHADDPDSPELLVCAECADL